MVSRTDFGMGRSRLDSRWARHRRDNCTHSTRWSDLLVFSVSETRRRHLRHACRAISVDHAVPCEMAQDGQADTIDGIDHLRPCSLGPEDISGGVTGAVVAHADLTESRAHAWDASRSVVVGAGPGDTCQARRARVVHHVGGIAGVARAAIARDDQPRQRVTLHTRKIQHKLARK